MRISLSCRLIALSMAVILVLGSSPIPLIADTVAPVAEIISFTILDYETARQTVPVGTGESELNLPVTLEATVYSTFRQRYRRY